MNFLLEYLAEMLRSRVERLRIDHINSNVSNHVTLSLGVATTLPVNDSPPEALLSRADQALYQAKQEGRNRVKVSTGQS
ncbi:MAG: GGDEF domain-containing protein [Firmicutes bacterium]|nr:GGDEF domain-containing protein [Bacillota bacterium]